MKVADILNKVEMINFELASLLGGLEGELLVAGISEKEKNNLTGEDYQNLDFDKKIDSLYTRRGKLIEIFGKWRDGSQAEHYFQSGDKMNLQDKIDQIVLFDKKLLGKLADKINYMSKELKVKRKQKQLLIYHQG